MNATLIDIWEIFDFYPDLLEIEYENRETVMLSYAGYRDTYHRKCMDDLICKNSDKKVADVSIMQKGNEIHLYVKLRADNDDKKV